jgi:phosphatidate cytidylyltransferase
MSPHIALHDPVFRDYFWIVLISLAIAGAVLGFLQFVLKKETASMFKTYCSWILIAGIGFIVLFLGRIPTIVGVTLLAIYAFKEFARASGLYRDSWMTGAVYAGIVTVGIASLISPPRGEEQGTGWYGFFVAVPAFAIALILLIPILRNRSRRAATHIARHYRFCLHRLDVRSPRIYR